MKIISILLGLSSKPTLANGDAERRAEWIRDPLSHPALEVMSERELADLPFRSAPSRTRLAEAGRA